MAFHRDCCDAFTHGGYLAPAGDRGDFCVATGVQQDVYGGVRRIEFDVPGKNINTLTLRQASGAGKRRNGRDAHHGRLKFSLDLLESGVVGGSAELCV